MAAEAPAAVPEVTSTLADNSSKQQPHVWVPKTESVTIFKNGLGFFTRRATVQLRDGWCYASEVPPAAFGTLAVYAHSPQNTVDLVGTGPGEVVAFDGHDAPQDIDNERRRLQDLTGLKVELHFEHQRASRSAAGMLASVGPDYAILETDAHTLAVALSDIQRIQVLDLPLRIHVNQAQGGAASDADLGIAYLRKGITWIPEYTLQILDEQTAELTLRGTVVNEAEDLVHCDVNFVVGVPHFVHSDSLSPVAIGRVIRTLGTINATEGVPQQVMSQIMNRAAIANSFVSPQLDAPPTAITQPAPPADENLASVLGNLPQIESAASGDYTVYKKEDLTIRRGERAIVTLFTHKIRYRHRYRWDTSSTLEHFLTLSNTTPTAWTTGPCLALADGSPLSEDLLKYTPRDGAGDLQVTTAINIAHSVSEEEIDRKLKAHEPRHNDFLDLVTIAGSIRLKSFEERPIEIQVTHPIHGRPLNADAQGSVQIDATKLRLVERAATITWRLTLQPGQETQLNYRYERYVPSL